MSNKIILGSSSITILKEVEWNLTDSEYEILPANDTEDFKEQMKTQQAGLFIIDRDMQEGLGGALCKEIKSSEQFSKVPVLLLIKQESAETDDAILAIGKETQADKVLTVPFDANKLLSTVQYFMAKQSAASDDLTQHLTTPNIEAGIPSGTEASTPSPEGPFIDAEDPQAKAGAPEWAAAAEEIMQEELQLDEGPPPQGVTEATPPPEPSFTQADSQQKASGTGDWASSAEEVILEELQLDERPSKKLKPQEAQSPEAVTPGAEMPEAEAGAPEWAAAAEEIMQEELQLDEGPPQGAAEFTPPSETATPGVEMSQKEAGIQSGPTPLEEGPSEELQLEETPSLSNEAALEETIKVVEDAIKRNKTTPEKTVQEEPFQMQPAQEFVSEQLPAKESVFPSQSDSWSSAPQAETGMSDTGSSNHPVVMWLKDILSQQMDTVIKKSVPEMTKSMIHDQMTKIIEQSVPELTRSLLQERITQIIDDKTLAKMMVQEINQNKEFVTNILTKEAPIIITQVVEKMVPDLAEKIIRTEIEHIKQGSG